MADKIAQNSFDGGLSLDLNPLVSQSNVYSDCLNGTFLTFNGLDYTLQNDMGNTTIEGLKYNIDSKEFDKQNNISLSEGFIPIGIKEFGGILYITSYNPLTKEGELGSYPSPTILDKPINFNSDLIDIDELINSKTIIKEVEFNGSKIILNKNDIINSVIDCDHWMWKAGLFKYSIFAGTHSIDDEDYWEKIGEEYKYIGNSPEYLSIKFEFRPPTEVFLQWDSINDTPYIKMCSKMIKGSNATISIQLLEGPNVNKTGSAKLIHDDSIFYYEFFKAEKNKEYNFTHKYTISYNEYSKTYIKSSKIIIPENINYGNNTSNIILEYRYSYSDNLLEYALASPTIYNNSEITCTKKNIPEGYVLNIEGIKRPCIQSDLYDSYFEQYAGKDYMLLSLGDSINYNAILKRNIESQSDYFEDLFDNEKTCVNFKIGNKSTYLFVVNSKYNSYPKELFKNNIEQSFDNSEVELRCNLEKHKFNESFYKLTKLDNSAKFGKGILAISVGGKSNSGHSDSHFCDLFHFDYSKSKKWIKQEEKSIYQEYKTVYQIIYIKDNEIHHIESNDDKADEKIINIINTTDDNKVYKLHNIHRGAEYTRLTIYDGSINNVKSDDLIDDTIYLEYRNGVLVKIYKPRGEDSRYIHFELYNYKIPENSELLVIDYLFIDLDKGDHDTTFNYKDYKNKIDQFIMDALNDCQFLVVGLPPSNYKTKIFYGENNTSLAELDGDDYSCFYLQSLDSYDNWINNYGSENLDKYFYEAGGNGEYNVTRYSSQILSNSTNDYKRDGYAIIWKLSDSTYAISKPVYYAFDKNNIIDNREDGLIKRISDNFFNQTGFKDLYISRISEQNDFFYKYDILDSKLISGNQIINTYEFDWTTSKLNIEENSILRNHLLLPNINTISIQLPYETSKYNNELLFEKLKNYMLDAYYQIESGITPIVVNDKHNILIKDSSNNYYNFDTLYDKSFTISNKYELNSFGDGASVIPKADNLTSSNYHHVYFAPGNEDTNLNLDGMTMIIS